MHLTDLHCGIMTPSKHVKHAVAIANNAKPDLVVMTGDYVSLHRSEAKKMEECLSGLSAPHVFATLGNHDYMACGETVAGGLRNCGYQVLRNETKLVDVGGVRVEIIGVDDPVTGKDDLAKAFEGSDRGNLRVVLSHCPESVTAIAKEGVDLVLSGHTHSGQINVFGIAKRIFRSMGKRFYGAGFYEVNDTILYVNPGIGFSGIPVRYGPGTRAEVALLRLVGSAS